MDVLPASPQSRAIDAATPRRREWRGLQLVLGLATGVFADLTAVKAIGNHAYIGAAELVAVTAVVLPLATRRWTFLAGVMAGAGSLIAAFVVLVMVVVFTGNLSVGGP